MINTKNINFKLKLSMVLSGSIFVLVTAFIVYKSFGFAQMSAESKEWFMFGCGMFLVLVVIWNVLHRVLMWRRLKSLDEVDKVYQAKIAENTEFLQKRNLEIMKAVEKEKGEMKKGEEVRAAMLNILEDIDAEKKNMAELTSRFDMATRSAHIGVLEWVVKENILKANDEFFTLYGATAEDFANPFTAWFNFVHPDERDRVKKLLDEALAKEAYFNAIIKIIKRDNNVRYFKILTRIDRDKMGQAEKLVGVQWDVTNEQEVDKAKSEFVSLASHQLRTPLSAINWYTEMLLAGDAGPLNEEQKKYLDEVYAGNKRMVDLVNSLLNVSRLELGTFIVEPELVDLVEMEKSVLSELQPQIVQKNLVVSEDLPVKIEKYLGDRKLLRMIFQNLLSNAVKYTPNDGKVSVSLKARKAGEVFGGLNLTGDVLSFSVIDSGIGIPKTEQDKIFDKLFRATNAKVSEAEGTGLGLYIVKSIIENSHGKIWYTSSPGLGTEFYVILPLVGMKKKEGAKSLD